MQERTMAIAQFETDKDAKEAGYGVQLSEPEAKELYGMNRKERRKWLSQQRKAARARLKQLGGKP